MKKQGPCHIKTTDKYGLVLQLSSLVRNLFETKIKPCQVLTKAIKNTDLPFVTNVKLPISMHWSDVNIGI